MNAWTEIMLSQLLIGSKFYIKKAENVSKMLPVVNKKREKI